VSWIWPEFINPDLPLTPDQRKAIRRDAWKLWSADKWNVILYLTLPAFYLLAVFFAADWGGWLATSLGAGGPAHKVFRAAGPVLLFVVCFVVGGAILQRCRFAPCVYRATRRHGYDVCTKCGYWLEGLGNGIKRCPECHAVRSGSEQRN
jgi:hypothetical protein